MKKLCNKTLLIWCLISVALFLNIFQIVAAKEVRKRGVMDNFNEGIKFAGQMFGINTAADVANLVAKAFSTTTNKNTLPDFMSIFQQRQQQSYASTEQEENDSTPQKQQTAQEEQAASENFPTSSIPRPPTKENVNIADFTAATFITNVLKMIGFDASKLGALAINALIMIAQAIGNTLMAATSKGPALTSPLDGGSLFDSNPTAAAPSTVHQQTDHQPRQLRDGSPMDWFLENPNDDMKRVLNEAMHTNLSDRITNMIDNLEKVPNEGACLKMLMCKSSPFIWGMQKSLTERLSLKDKHAENHETADDGNVLDAQVFFTNLPSIAEYREYGQKCEQLYANYCKTMRVYNQKMKT